MKIAILSKHYGKDTRGAEVWAKTLKERLSEFEIDIFSDVFDFGWTKYDLVIPVDGRLEVFLARVVSWLVGKSMIVFGHSGLGADDKWNLICSPNVFVAFSSYQKEWAEKYKLPWTKVVLIPHAVDLDIFTPLKRKSGKKIVLCVAANRPDKRINLVRGAVRQIPGAIFMAVGKDNPIEVGFDQMPGVYRRADLFCFVPQPWEAFGLVFLEAMASGLPVVTANDPIRREIVREAGIFVDNPENSSELALAIESALNKNWGDIPRKQAEKFSWDKIVAKYEEFFESLVKK